MKNTQSKDMAMDPFVYFFPSALSLPRIQKRLPSVFPYRLSFAQGEKSAAVVVDTFDAAMVRASNLLLQVGDLLLLMDLGTGQLIEQVVAGPWSFAGDLEPGPVRSLLQKVSSLRAFLPLAQVKMGLDHGLVLDDEGKTRVRFSNLTIGRGRKTIGLGVTRPLRGYGQAHADFCRLLEQRGASVCREVGKIYGALGLPQQYTAKPVVALQPDAPIRANADAIIGAFLRVARANERGVVGGYDTEFLHDYRVSLRKVRSVLSLFQEVYGREETARLKRDFAELMQKTNTLRDLDVYLFNRAEYLRLVPENTREGLDILFDYFVGQRKKEQKEVSRILRSKIYLVEIRRLEHLFAADSPLAGGPHGEENSLRFACRLILKRYRKVCKIARLIDSTTADTEIHQLRINCKKLRYLMEFFAPLFPDTEMASLIKALKVLQDNLGRFNDYAVQQRFLGQILREKMAAFGTRDIRVAESVGALTAILHRLQRRERRQIMHNFARFDSDEIHMTFTRLFHQETDADENYCLLQ